MGVQDIALVPTQKWRREMEILIFIVAVLLLDVLAFFLGADSRKMLAEQIRSIVYRA